MRYWKVIVHWPYWIWVVILKKKKKGDKRDGKGVDEEWTCNNIGAEGCTIISEILKENNTLIKVNLMGDVMRDEWIEYT